CAAQSRGRRHRCDSGREAATGVARLRAGRAQAAGIDRAAQERQRQMGEGYSGSGDQSGMTMLSRRKFLQLTAGVTALPFVSHAARAQAWPSRVVRFVVGFPAGGGADATTRILAQQLTDIWGQQVVVENRGGAGGNIAHDMVAHATPDGYTMLM